MKLFLTLFICCLFPFFAAHANSETSAIWNEIKDARLITVVNGMIPQAPVGSDESKDFSIVEKAHLIVSLDSSFKNFSEAEKEKILAWNQIYLNTTAPFFAGNNQKALQITVSSFDFSQSLSLDEMIKSEVYLSSSFWRGGPEIALITSANSRSPLRALFGEGSSRTIYWPWNPQIKSNDLQADLSALRISVMRDSTGEMKAVEVIARGPQTEWEPFVYEKQWGRWFPIQSIRNKVPVKDFCLRCHVTSSGAFSPKPSNVPSFEMFEKIGYRNKSIIHEMMGY